MPRWTLLKMMKICLIFQETSLLIPTLPLLLLRSAWIAVCLLHSHSLMIIHRRKAQPPAQLVEWDSPPWGKTFAFPPKGGLANRSFFTGRPLKSGSLLMLHPIPFVLLLNILLYCLFVDITDRFAIISSCPEVTVSFLSIFWMPVKYHKRTLALNKAYGL